VTGVVPHHRLDGAEDRPVVVLLGSLGSTLSMWDPQVPALAGRFRVLRVDTRGHGGSPVPPGPYRLDDLVDDVVALLDGLGIARAHVVGLSLGGMVAMRLAAREPARVDRLALLCTSALLGTPQMWADRAALVRAEGAGAVAASVVGRWLSPAGRDPEVVARLEAMVAATPAEGYAACCEAVGAMDLRGDLAGIVAPTLALAGAEDPSTTPEHLAAIVAAIPGARLQVLAAAAHLANVEQPAAVNAALLAHLDPAGESPSERGMRVRRAVLGDAHVDRASAASTPFTAPFQEFITRQAWGDVWSRPGLDRRSRSMITVALLAALGHERELELHLHGAITNGLTPAEISEVLLHTAVYAGAPAANTAFAIAQRVLSEPTAEPTDGRAAGRLPGRAGGVAAEY
jgi:3-oxoadipate enol-lactonase/4-carboxymuconolactone decarboxylase